MDQLHEARGDKGLTDIDGIPEFLSQLHIFEVSELTQKIREKLTSSSEFKNLGVRGEITNFTKSSAGHIYFSIKDKNSTMRCVAFRGKAERLTYIPKEGDSVILFGSIDIYPQGGSYQLYVEEIFSTGRGELYERYLELKADLEKEGLFDSSHRKPIPEYPSVIGVVTSPKGAALRDILNILSRQASHVQVIISPSLVQGNEAPPRIIEALERLTSLDTVPDIVILARGGGSFEDLFCFNDEALVRYVADYPIPIITGVGHETDFTLVDFVSDLRSPTPTGAAQDAAPDRRMLIEEVGEYVKGWRDYLLEGIEGYREIIDDIMSRPVFKRPEQRWAQFHQEIDFISERMYRVMVNRVTSSRKEVLNLQSLMEHTNPNNLLKKGYSIAQRLDNGKLLRDSKDIKSGEKVKVKLGRGDFIADVESTEHDNG